MSTKVADIRAAIVAKIALLPGAGVVHNRERYADTLDGLVSLYVSSGVLQGWFVRRLSTVRRRPAIGRLVVVHTWAIRAYRAYDDAGASELSFDDLVESFGDAIRDDDTLGGVVTSCAPDGLDGEAGVQLEDSGPVMFAGVLAHSARLKLRTLHFETAAS